MRPEQLDEDGGYLEGSVISWYAAPEVLDKGRGERSEEGVEVSSGEGFCEGDIVDTGGQKVMV